MAQRRGTMEEVILRILLREKLITESEYEKALKLLKEQNDNSNKTIKDKEPS